MKSAAVIGISFFAALISSGAAAQVPATGEQIVVQGQSQSAQIRQFVEQLTPAPGDSQLGKFLQPVCPSVTGLSEGGNQTVADRMRQVAKAAGIDTAAPGCNANIALLVVTNKAAAIESLERRSPQLFDGLPGADIRRMKIDGEPVAAWQVVEEIGADGIPLQLVRVSKNAAASEEARMVRSFGATSRVKQLTVPRFLGSIIIVEAGAAKDFTRTQLADYALMRGLVGLDDRKPAPPQSILGLLDADASGTQAPLSVTPLDLALLKSLYATTNDVSASDQRGAIAHRMATELSEAPQPSR